MGDLFKLMNSFNKSNNNGQAESMLNLFSKLNKKDNNQNFGQSGEQQSNQTTANNSNMGLDISKLLPLFLTQKGASPDIMPLLSQMPGFNTYKPMFDLFNDKAKTTSIEKNKHNIKPTLTIKNYKKLN